MFQTKRTRDRAETLALYAALLPAHLDVAMQKEAHLRPQALRDAHSKAWAAAREAQFHFNRHELAPAR